MDMLRLNVIKKMKNNSAKTILLADNSKVGKKYSYRGFGFEDIDYVIMDSVPNDRALVKALGKKLITAKRI
jgi:DeoR/GlpR family transcriptional regulator of sugar metabolism